MRKEDMVRLDKTDSYFMGLLDRLGGTLLEPGKTFEQMIAEKRGYLEPLLIVFLFHGIQGALIGSFIVRIILYISMLVGQLFGTPPPYIGFVVIIPAITFFLGFIVALILWLILASIAHLCAKYVFKGAGSFTQLLKLYGYASVPYSLVIIATVLTGISMALFSISMILSLTAIFWTVLVMVVAVERSYQIDPGKAFISSFIGPIIIVLILLVIGWLLSLMGGMFA